MISGATTLKVIFGEHYLELWYASTIDSLSSLWIATGCFLFVLSIMGIAAALKESTMMTNFVSINDMIIGMRKLMQKSNLQYGLFMSLVFILQIAAAILGFTLITQTDGIVRESINSMMYRQTYSYDYGIDNGAMDWVQETVQSFF